jgi:hypothetical protein
MFHDFPMAFPYDFATSSSLPPGPSRSRHDEDFAVLWDLSSEEDTPRIKVTEFDGKLRNQKGMTGIDRNRM